MDLAGHFLQRAIMSIDTTRTPTWAIFKEMMMKCCSQDEGAGGISLTVPSIG